MTLPTLGLLNDNPTESLYNQYIDSKKHFAKYAVYKEIKMTDVVFHILKDGESRSTMIREIVEQLNGDQDVLAEGWENGTTEEIFELWTILVQDLAE